MSKEAKKKESAKEKDKDKEKEKALKEQMETMELMGAEVEAATVCGPDDKDKKDKKKQNPINEVNLTRSTAKSSDERFRALILCP